jgi:hypothetical protein
MVKTLCRLVGADPGRWTLMRTATSQPQPADLVPSATTGTVESMLVSAYRPSFVSRVRPSTLAKIASCATRGIPSQMAEAATHRSAS